MALPLLAPPSHGKLKGQLLLVPQGRCTSGLIPEHRWGHSELILGPALNQK